ncbi:MAG: HesA/MoeB/ThiF family protein [Deltaproteobacteria bacterium]|nr:MAG: HesA/MoeB/ThiF family protein [Deltaproteobacteria bacterium]
MQREEKEILRFSRNILVREIGPAGQRKLRSSSVLVVGAGGLGSPALYYLASAGVGRLGIVDYDRVDLTNLNRQILFTERDTGRDKVSVAAERVRAIDSSIEVDAWKEKVTAENVFSLIEGFDIVVDGTDSFETKFLLNDACVIAGIPLSHAGILRFGGQAMSIVPGEGPCLRCLLPQIPSRKDAPTCSEAGIVGSVAGIFGSIQATEVIKFLTGAGTTLTGRVLSIDTLHWTIQTLQVERNVQCPVCGEDPVIRKPLSAENYGEICAER